MSRWQMPRRASATYAFLAAQAATQYPTPAGDRSRLFHDRTRGSEDTPPLLLQLLEGARPAWWRRSPAPSPTCWTRRATGATSGGRRPEAATSPSPTELCLASGLGHGVGSVARCNTNGRSCCCWYLYYGAHFIFYGPLRNGMNTYPGMKTPTGRWLLY